MTERKLEAKLAPPLYQPELEQGVRLVGERVRGRGVRCNPCVGRRELLERAKCYHGCPRILSLEQGRGVTGLGADLDGVTLLCERSRKSQDDVELL